MLQFKNDQTIVDIGGVKVGGQPGELATVLIGSIFHEGHKIVYDRKKGIFNKRRAEQLILKQKEMSLKTGNPRMLDVVGETLQALCKYLEFVSDIDDCPILVNGPNFKVRVSACEYAFEIGLRDRIIYNSINYTFGNEEAEAIRDIEVKNALIQAFNPRDPRPSGMLSMINKLVRNAKKAGVENILALTPVLDVPGIGLGVKGVSMIKEELGLPTGTVPVGVIGRWRKNGLFSDKDLKKKIRASAVTLAQAMGADFIIYGSLAKAPQIFPVCGFIDALISYQARIFGLRPLTRNHPFYKVL